MYLVYFKTKSGIAEAFKKKENIFDIKNKIISIFGKEKDTIYPIKVDEDHVENRNGYLIKTICDNKVFYSFIESELQLSWFINSLGAIKYAIDRYHTNEFNYIFLSKLINYLPLNLKDTSIEDIILHKDGQIQNFGMVNDCSEFFFKNIDYSLCFDHLNPLLRMDIANRKDYLPTREQYKFGIYDKDKNVSSIYKKRYSEWDSLWEQTKLNNMQKNSKPFYMDIRKVSKEFVKDIFAKDKLKMFLKEKN